MSEEHAQIVTDNGMPPVQAEDQGYRVYVGNLPYTATEEQVREFVAPVGGEIVNVSLPLKFNKKPSGFAFVGYATADVAKKAVDELNDKPFADRTAHVQLARSKEETEERRKATQERRAAEKATKALEKKQKILDEGGVIGEGDGVAKPKRRRGDRRRRGPGEGDEEAGEGAANGEVDAEGAEKPKRKPRNRKPKQAQEARIDGAEGEAAPAAEGAGEAKPKKAKKPRQPKMALSGEQSKSTVFVGNLPFTVDDNALAEIFTNLSIKVKSAKVVTGYRKPRGDARGFRGSKGFGFVEVEDPSQQQEAVDKVEGSLIGDRKISAKVANEMKPIEVEAAEVEADVAQATA